jgi:hypothetical protein
MNLQDIAQINMTNKINSFESIGCSIDMQDRMVDIVKTEYPNKQYCIVDHWSWNHISLNESELCDCKAAGFLPEFILSDSILQCSACTKCNCIKSELLSELVNNCIFVTESICYILVNKGMFNITTLNDALAFSLMNDVDD